ncbi:MAG: hypothetical protein R3A11_01935 [Bdellovibrionota bacterium]
MSELRLENVFGVSKDQVLSYVEREEVDGLFAEALQSDKQIVVYGASKQGKTSLVDKHLPYKQNIVVSLTPKFTLTDIYKSVLRSSGIDIETMSQKSMCTSNQAAVEANLQAKVPTLLDSGVSGSLQQVNSETETKSIKSIDLNLELPNDIAFVLNKIHSKKIIVLENFHYLKEEVQKEFAYDLRSFQELGVRFIILGVWREKNRLIQFNGDLLDRIFEIPVEPWEKEDFKKVAQIGSEKLNISIANDFLDQLIDDAFDSIGVVQELLKSVCEKSSIKNRQTKQVEIVDIKILEQAKSEKVHSYGSRHLRALEAIAEGRKNAKNTKSDDLKTMPLYLPYYTVKAFLDFDFNEVVAGIKRSKLESKIKSFHHRRDDVRASDMSNLLYNFATLQSEKQIKPPIFDFDKTTQMLRVIDSTFYFFLRNSDKNEILGTIPNPTIN